MSESLVRCRQENVTGKKIWIRKGQEKSFAKTILEWREQAYQISVDRKEAHILVWGEEPHTHEHLLSVWRPREWERG